MKHSSRSEALRFFCLGLIAAIPVSGFAATHSAVASNKPAAPATHTLYLGSDVAIEWKGQLCPVQDVQGNAFVISADGKRVVVPANSANLRIKIEDNLKLTTALATVADLKADRVYTPETDPRAKFDRMVSLVNGASANSDIAAGNMRNLQSLAGVAQGVAANASPLDGGAIGTANEMAAAAATAEQAYTQSVEARWSDSFLTVSNHLSAMETELAHQRYDALSITFDLASSRPLEDAYLVAMIRYREDPEKPGTSRLLVYAQALPDIDATPRSIRLYRAGLPPGYELESYQIHVYNKGSEIATTAARKQVPLTAEEAFQYSISDYAAKNRDKTLPPVSAREFWPEELRVKSAAGRSDTVLYVKVDRNGKPAGVYEDEACARKVDDPAIQSAVSSLYFFPALNKGKLTDGVASLKLSQLGH